MFSSLFPQGPALWLTPFTRPSSLFVSSLPLGLACCGQRLPDLLCDKGDHGVEKPQCRLQHSAQHVAGVRSLLFALRSQPHLCHLYIPVTVVIPEELVEQAGGIVHIVVRKRSVHSG